MTQSERREYLIEYLLKEDRKIFRQKMPSDKEGQENLLHSLMNVRMPKPASEEFHELTTLSKISLQNSPLYLFLLVLTLQS